MAHAKAKSKAAVLATKAKIAAAALAKKATAKAVAAAIKATKARASKAPSGKPKRIAPAKKPAPAAKKPAAKATAAPAKKAAPAAKATAAPAKKAAAKVTAAPAKKAAATAAPKAARAKKTKAAVPTKTSPATAGTTVDAVPVELETAEARRLSLTARERMMRSSPVVEILDDDHPIGALRRFLDSVKGEATPQQAQIALGSAQLMLLPSEHDRGTPEVKELVDLVLHHWDEFGERRKGFHAQEFLRNALAAIGVDRERIKLLEELIPTSPSTELLVNLAAAYAVTRDKVAMMRAAEHALEAGASAADFRRHTDFVPYANDPDLAVLLARAEVPQIPVDIDPYLPGVRAALDSLLSTLKEFGESVDLRPGVRLDAILDAERAGKLSLPNDYRALLTLTNGMRLWEHEFFSAGDYREHTKLATRAHQFLESRFGTTGIAECVPVANWGQPNDWLLYDPRGRLRGGEAGYVLMLNADGVPVEDLAAALLRMEHLAREVLGTN